MFGGGMQSRVPVLLFQTPVQVGCECPVCYFLLVKLIPGRCKEAAGYIMCRSQDTGQQGSWQREPAFPKWANEVNNKSTYFWLACKCLVKSYNETSQTFLVNSLITYPNEKVYWLKTKPFKHFTIWTMLFLVPFANSPWNKVWQHTVLENNALRCPATRNMVILCVHVHQLAKGAIAFFQIQPGTCSVFHHSLQSVLLQYGKVIKN